MKCEKCKINEACYHSTIIINGESKSTNLCMECAKKEGFKENNFFENFFNEFKTIQSSLFDDFMCTSCHTPFKMFRNNNFLGCPDCFDVFKTDLQDYLINNEQIKFNTPSKKEIEIEELKIKLKKAIEEERYEDAGDYNKRLKKLQEED